MLYIFGVIRVFFFTCLLLQTYLRRKGTKRNGELSSWKDLQNHWSRHKRMLHRQYIHANQHWHNDWLNRLQITKPTQQAQVDIAPHTASLRKTITTFFWLKILRATTEMNSTKEKVISRRPWLVLIRSKIRELSMKLVYQNIKKNVEKKKRIVAKNTINNTNSTTRRKDKNITNCTTRQTNTHWNNNKTCVDVTELICNKSNISIATNT